MDDKKKRTQLTALIRNHDTKAAGERLAYVSKNGEKVYLDQRSRLADPFNILGLSPVVICPEVTIQPDPIVLSELNDTATRQNYDITIELVEVRIGKDDEDQRRFAGYFGNIPDDNRDNKFRDRLRDHGRNQFARRQQLTVEFASKQRELEDEFHNWILATFGLDATVHLAYDQKLRVYDLGDGVRISCSARDAEKLLNTTIKLTVAADPAFKPAESTRTPLTQQDLKPLVEAVTQDYVRKNVSLHRYYFNVDPPSSGAAPQRESESWTVELLNRIDGKLSERGYRIADHSITPDTPVYGNAKIEGEAKAKYKPINWPDGAAEIDVTCRAQLQLVNAALYEKHKCPPIDGWLQGAHEKAVREALFETTYTKLLVHWAKQETSERGPYEERIRKNIEEQAAKIGYDVMALVTKPELEAIQLPDGVTLLVGEDKDSADAVYETKDLGVTVRYQIEARFRIPDLMQIQETLDQNPDITGHIKTVLRNEALFFTKSKTAEDFYLRFSRWQDDPSTAQAQRNGVDAPKPPDLEAIEVIAPNGRTYPPVIAEPKIHEGFEGELAHKLSETLRTKFCADRITVRIFQHPTAITDLFKRLTSLGARRIDFVFKPYGNQSFTELTADYDEIPISIELAVTGMASAVPDKKQSSGWNQFQNFNWDVEVKRLGAGHEIDVVLAAVQRALESSVRTIEFNRARFRTAEEKVKFAGDLRGIVDEALRNGFGLTGRIVNLTRQHTIAEDLAFEKKKAELQALANSVNAARVEQQIAFQKIEADKIDAEDRIERRKLLLERRRKQIEEPDNGHFDPTQAEYTDIESELKRIDGERTTTGDAHLAQVIRNKLEKDQELRIELLAAGKESEVKDVERRIKMWETELAKYGAQRSNVTFAQLGLLEDKRDDDPEGGSGRGSAEADQ